jgi:hypothetical protein
VHPRGVSDAVGILDVLGNAEAEVLQVLTAAGNVRGDLVEVVQADQFPGGVEVVALGEAFDVLDVVEELVREAQRILDADGVAHALCEALLAALNAATQLAVVRLGGVDLGRGLHTVGEGSSCGDRALAEDQVVVDELLEGAQVDGVLVLFCDVQAQQVHVERAGLLQVRDYEFQVRAADDIRSRDCGSGDGAGEWVAHGILSSLKGVIWMDFLYRYGPLERVLGALSVQKLRV